MKKIIVLILLIIGCLSASTETSVDNEKARNAAMTLNYLHGSLNKIVLYNDKIVLEEEYNNIINNLNLTVIEDPELVHVITYLMDTLTQFRLSEMDREKFRKEYEEKLEGAMSGALVGLANIRGSNPIELGVNAVLGIGSAYLNYKNAQKSLKNELKDSTYELDKGAITDLNNIRKEFIITYWEIMKRYNMPDEWRVSEKQFTRLIDILKDDNDEKQYRQLLRMQDELAVLPMFWYELSLVARKLQKKDDELNFISKYESLNDKLFRHNSMYSLLLANKISYMNINTDKEEIIQSLKKIYEIDSLNANRKLFSAMKYMQLGDYANADSLLTQNIDDNFLANISGRLKLNIYLDTNKEKEFEETITELLQKQNLSTKEYLYYLGKRPTHLMISEIEEEIKKIKVDLNKNIYGKESLEVSLSKRWVIQDIEDTEFNLLIDDKIYKFEKIKVEEDFIKYSFKDVIDLSEIKEESFISFEFKHKHVPVKLVYKMSLKKDEPTDKVEVKEEKKDSYLNLVGNKITNTIDKIKDSEIVEKIKDNEVTNYINPVYNNASNKAKSFLYTEVFFKPMEILTEDKCFDIQNGMKECNK